VCVCVCVIDLYCIIVQLITNHDENPLRTSKRVKQVSAGKLKPWAIPKTRWAASHDHIN
jgi:hypothetical protein